MTKSDGLKEVSSAKIDLKIVGGAGDGAANCCQNKSSADAVGAETGVEAGVEAGGSVVVVVGEPAEVVDGTVVGGTVNQVHL